MKGVRWSSNVRFGYIDKRGEYVIPPRFEAGTSFQEGFAAVKLGGKWGYVGLNGEWFITPRFEVAQPFHGGEAYARHNGQSGAGGYTRPQRSVTSVGREPPLGVDSILTPGVSTKCEH